MASIGKVSPFIAALYENTYVGDVKQDNAANSKPRKRALRIDTVKSAVKIGKPDVRVENAKRIRAVRGKSTQEQRAAESLLNLTVVSQVELKKGEVKKAATNLKAAKIKQTVEQRNLESKKSFLADVQRKLEAKNAVLAAAVKDRDAKIKEHALLVNKVKEAQQNLDAVKVEEVKIEAELREIKARKNAFNEVYKVAKPSVVKASRSFEEIELRIALNQHPKITQEKKLAEEKQSIAKLQELLGLQGHTLVSGNGFTAFIPPGVSLDSLKSPENDSVDLRA